MIAGKSVLITGATGSFGRHAVQRLLDRGDVPRIVIFSRDELKQSDLQARWPAELYPQLRFFLGDVRDYERLRQAFHGVDYVIHAAAMKQVPAAESNPLECIKTNVGGAENVVRASIDAGVQKVIALSTDKAANPINLYGATKLCSDKLFVAGNNITGSNPTLFSVVRYGNVMGSRGSVIPLFRRLIDEGATELPITHEEMTRFWITLSRGVDFVFEAFDRMQGGEIFVPKIPSMKMIEVAKAMAPALQQRIIGLRAGEKMHEVMCPADEAHLTLEFPDHYVIRPTINFNSPVDYCANAKGESGHPVAADFSYASNTNDEWMSSDQLLQLIGT